MFATKAIEAEFGGVYPGAASFAIPSDQDGGTETPREVE